MPIRATCLLLFAFSAGCGDSDGDLTEVFGNSQAIDTVKNTSSVRAFRLLSSREDYDTSESLSDYATTGGPINVSNASASELRALLLDPSSYDWESAKSCIPRPGVRIQFQHETDEVDVLLGFECDILLVLHNGTLVGGEDFDDISPQLAAIVKELFPDDVEIQSLETPSTAPWIAAGCAAVGFMVGCYFWWKRRRLRD